VNHNLILKKYKAPLLVALSSGLRLIFSLISVKITAVILGPSGTGVIGQINNLLLILTTISGGGISAGLTNIVSQSQDKISLKRQMATAHGYGILCIAILSILLIFASSINSSAFPYNQDNLTLIVLILAQYPIFQITSISAILNAKGLQFLSSISLVLAGILNPLFIYIGSVNFGIKGCIYGIILGSVIQWPILATIAKKN
jgi:O-antigen/teichoic acid export membrane protein